MTDLTASGTGDTADFTDTVIGEVVVQIETFDRITGNAGQIVELLRIFSLPSVAMTSA